MSLGPAALVRSLPAALGRQPHGELVLVGVSSLAPEAAVIVTVGIDSGRWTEDAAAAAIHDSIGVLVRDGARKIAVLVYADDTSPDSTAARYAATAVVCAEAAGLDVLDAIAVSGGRWRSYDCDNPSCCPPEGHPITEGPTP
jgi:hypothetical protein